MPKKDIIHDAVKNALVKDGWIVTADPYRIEYGDETLFIDLAAQQLLAAERGEQKIAVEIKSFLSRSPIHDLEVALGQYALYLSVLEVTDPQRKLYLAVGKAIFDELAQMKVFSLILKRYQVSLIIVSTGTEEILEWIN